MDNTNSMNLALAAVFVLFPLGARAARFWFRHRLKQVFGGLSEWRIESIKVVKQHRLVSD